MPVIQTPSNQIKLTNVSLVRMKKGIGKKRFEIACYKNKVLEWRNATETDLDNVLQSHRVFANVGKGQFASSQDLAKAFGADRTLQQIILEILDKGELQVGEKERNAQLLRVRTEVIDIVAGKLVDPQTKRVYTAGMIEKALEQLSSPLVESDGGREAPKRSVAKWCGVNASKSAKSQALDAMRALIAHQPIPVARARMRLRITCPNSILKQAVRSAPSTEEEDVERVNGTVKDRILGYIEEVESQEVVGDEWECTAFIEPGTLRTLAEYIGRHTKGRAKAEVLDMAVIHED